MRLRYTSNALIGAAAVLSLGASLASAQATSQRRIPISKEAPGEVARRVDTVTVYKTDTLRLTGETVYRTDTVRVTNTVTRVDTVIPPAPPVRLPGGFYFGVGGGVMAPNGALFTPNSAGPSAQAQIGWQGARSLLGLRLDGNWAKPGEDSFYSTYQADPDIVNLNGDVKLQLPWFHHLFGQTPSFSVYGIGGGSYIMYKNLPMRLETGLTGGVGAANVLVGDTDWQKHWGWNAGGGVSLGWRRTELFLESRVIAWDTDVTPQARQIPFVLGINWY
jgi:hypothetical protein